MLKLLNKGDKSLLLQFKNTEIKYKEEQDNNKNYTSGLSRF